MPDVFVAQPKEKENSDSPSQKHRTYPHNPLSAYIYYPRDANFINQDPEEKVVLILRRHPVTNLSWIIIGILMLFAPAVLSFFPILEFLPDRFQFIAVIIWYLITVAYIFEHFLAWFFNVNIITDERIIDVDFINLIYREMTDANIDKVQDVTVRMGSAIRTVLNYGDIVIQTAAEIPQIEFKAIPRPDRVARILRDLRIEEEVEKLEGRLR